MRTSFFITTFVLALCGAAVAQPQPAKPGAQPPAPATPAQTPAAEKPAAPTAEAPAAPAPQVEAYTYRAEGRRDPFQTLIGAGTGSVATSRRGEGATGLAVAEISVRGIMQSRGSLVAMIRHFVRHSSTSI